MFNHVICLRKNLFKKKEYGKCSKLKATTPVSFEQEIK